MSLHKYHKYKHKYNRYVIKVSKIEIEKLKVYQYQLITVCDRSEI